MKWLLLCICILFSAGLNAQVNGGEHAMAFLRLPASAHITALGSMAVSTPSKDLMLSAANPALLRAEYHTQLSLGYNLYYAGTRVMNLRYAHHHPALQTTFTGGLQYIDYGTFDLNDMYGNTQGQGQAKDYCLQLGASRTYGSRWHYGAALKYAHSRLLTEKASAFLFDAGIHYADTLSHWYFGAVVKNAGWMLKNYEAGFRQPLPLDIQIGVTKKFKKAPFSISVLGHRLYEWDIRYDNPADREDNALIFGDSTQTETSNHTADKIFRHLVFALDMQIGKRIEISAGYNHLRRAELALDEKKGMSGFSAGAGVYLNKFIIHVARSYYHLTGAYTEIGITFQMNRLFGLGQAGKSINWSQTFAR